MTMKEEGRRENNKQMVCGLSCLLAFFLAGGKLRDKRKEGKGVRGKGGGVGVATPHMPRAYAKCTTRTVQHFNPRSRKRKHLKC